MSAVFTRMSAVFTRMSAVFTRMSAVFDSTSSLPPLTGVGIVVIEFIRNKNFPVNNLSCTFTESDVIINANKVVAEHLVVAG